MRLSASKDWRSRNLIGPAPTIRVTEVVVDVDLDAGVVGRVRTREANKILARVRAGAGDVYSGGRGLGQLNMEGENEGQGG